MENQKNDQETLNQAVSTLQDKVSHARIVGRLENGKLVLDDDQIKQISELNPNACFIALNSPFDPHSLNI